MQDQIGNIKIMERKRREHPKSCWSLNNLTRVTEIPKEDSMKQKNIWRNNDPEFSKFYGRHNATGPRNSEKK